MVATNTIVFFVFDLFFSAIATLDFKQDGMIGIIGIIYILLLNLICAISGVGSALLIQPGSRILVGDVSQSAPISTSSGLTASDVFKDLF